MLLLFSVWVAESDELFILFTVCFYHERLSVSFLFGSDGGMWGLVVLLVPTQEAHEVITTSN